MSFSKLISKILQVLGSRAFLLLLASLLVISFTIAYVASDPRPQERFLSISTLGSDMVSSNYYSRGNSTIYVHQHVNWNLDVYNRMGTTEYLSVRVKLLNSTQIMPDDDLHIPSPEKELIEMRYMLPNNATWVVPLDWVIRQIVHESEYVVIKSLDINGIEIDDLNIRSVHGKNFRMIIELWRYDKEIEDFGFAWSSGLDNRSAWNQIWFNLK